MQWGTRNDTTETAMQHFPMLQTRYINTDKWKHTASAAEREIQTGTREGGGRRLPGGRQSHSPAAVTVAERQRVRVTARREKVHGRRQHDECVGGCVKAAERRDEEFHRRERVGESDNQRGGTQANVDMKWQFRI